MEKEKKGGIESRIVNYCFDPLSWSSTIAAEERVCVSQPCGCGERESVMCLAWMQHVLTVWSYC